jgi:hypothetical protein
MAGDDDDGAGGPGKDGLKAAIDVTKYTLAISGAAIAFLLSSDSLNTITNGFSKTTVTLALMGFGVSAIAGLLVLLQGASNIANADYDLGQPFIKYPGIANILGLIVGFFFATIFIISIIWH